MCQGKGSLTGAVNTTRKLSEKGMKKSEVKKAAKKSKTSKPNVICGEVAPQKPERNERQPTSLNQENLGRCQNIDQSQLSISANTIDNIRDVNRDVNRKNQTSSLPVDRTNPPVDSHAMQQPSSSWQFNQIYSHPQGIDFRTPEFQHVYVHDFKRS